MALTATDASWKTPRILRNVLTTWAARDDTRPDQKARAAADDALTAIDAMVAELLALRSRLTAEIVSADLRQELAEAEGRAPSARAASAAPADGKAYAPGDNDDKLAPVFHERAACLSPAGCSGCETRFGDLKLANPAVGVTISEAAIRADLSSATPASEVLTFDEAHAELAARGYSKTEAARVLYMAEQATEHTSALAGVTVHMMWLRSEPRYTITPDRPLYAVPDGYDPVVRVPYAGVLDDESIAAIQAGSAGAVSGPDDLDGGWSVRPRAVQAAR